MKTDKDQLDTKKEIEERGLTGFLRRFLFFCSASLEERLKRQQGLQRVMTIMQEVLDCVIIGFKEVLQKKGRHTQLKQIHLIGSFTPKPSIILLGRV